jgi:hypothetical protein
MQRRVGLQFLIGRLMLTIDLWLLLRIGTARAGGSVPCDLTSRRSAVSRRRQDILVLPWL